MASVAPSAISPRRSAGMTSSPFSPGWKTPSDFGVPLPGTSQSSKRLFLSSAGSNRNDAEAAALVVIGGKQIDLAVGGRQVRLPAVPVPSAAQRCRRQKQWRRLQSTSEAKVSERQKAAEFQRPCEKERESSDSPNRRASICLNVSRPGLAATSYSSVKEERLASHRLTIAANWPVPAHPLLDHPAILERENTKHVFAGEHLVAGAASLALIRRCHRSMHSLSFKRLRRSHVRIVFRGRQTDRPAPGSSALRHKPASPQPPDQLPTLPCRCQSAFLHPLKQPVFQGRGRNREGRIQCSVRRRQAFAPATRRSPGCGQSTQASEDGAP